METLTKSYTVMPEMTAKYFASGTLDVFATPSLVGCMEDTAKTIIDPKLQEGESSVGTKIAISHVKASPVGATIEVTAILVKQEGRMYEFEVMATQDGELIGEGTHTRAVINIERFMSKVNR
ncbi:MAG: thioesterase family protein [Oscillospiraceae bacterium]